ncbi:MOG interacting and ectopic P-granules protein 1 [Leptopilina heterotoma]|uniref:MOG interacting and ectopic P-granules protein 1 n=1 Tax=Leptopilina heterotoma TaxID=63436 RepID=UPI001CA95F83|nr:MOG interacting and ectopic P-granules protein 1 [Leptopilina heterotoma]XP_043465126.1 MOG interacting and ectopic P-granules protein 1 [Leptopilina heterotoma]XP_043465127.1 MOG interacting and ectopic P-granules protein 1 [Leptopilina heterotoma]XP_043465128.1 MOG interacting and ectopic P-granules protein 1 [Leptopilina heterotoma]XP_043465129.1 MOG interacting and ectopic P-granules protein 1 [Leptopilina heterotoma]XP_043465130.1 MOG interacting and ectopic P-granules protein 1 [Lepto
MEGTLEDPLVKDPCQDDDADTLLKDSSDKIIPNGVNGGYDDADAEEFADSCEEQNSPGNKEVNEIDDDDDNDDESNDVDEDVVNDDNPGSTEVEAIDSKDNDNSNDGNESSAAQDSERVMGIETVDDEDNDDDIEMRENFDDNPEDSESRGSTRENVDKDIVELSNHSKISDSMEVLNGPDVSEVSKIVKESKETKCDEAMDVDAQSNNSDVECLDESITQIDSDNDDVFTIEKPETTNKKRTSGSSDIQQIDESGEIIDSSLDTSDVKICEENGSVGSPDIEEITDSSKSNGHNSEQDGSTKGSPKQKKPRKQVDLSNITPRRSSRNIKRTSYIEKEPEEEAEAPDDGSDIEEIKMEDPLAGIDIKDKENSKSKSPIKNSKTTIVVSDTKRLVEIAASSKASKGGKKEPTLVIIDTNSILSGRGGVPISSNAKPQSVPSSTSFSVVPMSMAPQSMYPNMRTTITPVPMKSTPTKPATVTPIPSPAQVLPALTDDMFVVEAPSFIVPYVYEKPPINPMKEFLTKLKKGIEEVEKEEKKAADEKREKEKEENPDDSENESEHSKKDDTDDLSPDEKQKSETKPDDRNKVQTYFELPLGKFFMQIGMNLVQEFVQTDLLRTQKRKQGKGTPSAETQMAINSLIKNLEFSKENNEPFHLEMKKCEFCNFKTESTIVMQHHLETPHMKNYVYKCNFCPMEIRSPHDILFHMEAEHNARGRLERGPAFHQCPNCPFEDNQKGKLTRHTIACAKKFRPERNLEPATDWEPPAKIPRLNRARQSMPTSPSALAMAMNAKGQQPLLPKLLPAPMPGRGRGRPPMQPRYTDLKTLRPGASPIRQEGVAGMMYRPTSSGLLVPTAYQFGSNQIFQNPVANSKGSSSKALPQPSISITPLPRTVQHQQQQQSSVTATSSRPAGNKSTFVICEICDGYIKDLEQLRNHMQWIHKVKIHPKMIYNRPPLNCQKCQFRFFTDQGLERHLLGSHGLVTSSMQEAANKGKDAGRCPACGRVYQWKLLNHVARDHGMTLKPAHLSYKCTVCTATFGMYKQFENHVYSAHSVVAKRVIDKKNAPSSPSSRANDSLLKPLKINDEITIIPQPAKPTTRSIQGRGK